MDSGAGVSFMEGGAESLRSRDAEIARLRAEVATLRAHLGVFRFRLEQAGVPCPAVSEAFDVDMRRGPR